MSKQQVQRFLAAYPRIFLACHTSHVRDPETSEQLSAHQAGILDHLDSTEPLGLVQLARHMGVTPATMSIAIDHLVKRGYVVRERDPQDKRRVCLLLSPAGARIKEAQTVLDPDLVLALLEQLSPKDRTECLRGLELLAAAAVELQRIRSEQGAWTRRGRSQPSTRETS